MTGVAAASQPVVCSKGQLAERSPQPSREHARCRLKDPIVGPIGMRFDARLPFEEWRQLGTRIAMRSNASLWWLGDWLCFGQEKYGRRYKGGVAVTGLDYQTLRNYAVVARRFEVSRRRDNVSFQHHAEVCALADAEQDRWLDRAERGRWSRNELRRRRQSDVTQRSQAVSASLRLPLDSDRRELWHRAALHDDCDLESWIMRTLDEAAATVLSVGSRRSGLARKV